MKLEFGKPLPEDLSIPNLTGYPKIICDKVFRTLEIRSKEASISFGNHSYQIITGNDEDKFFFSSSQSNSLSLSQHQELDLFVVLIKFAHEQGILESILSVDGGNFLSFLTIQSGGKSMRSPLHQGLDSMECLDQNLSSNTDRDFSPFNIGKGHHCNRETYKVSNQEDGLLFSFNGETLYTIHDSEIVTYLRLITSTGSGIAAQCLYALEYIFSEL